MADQPRYLPIDVREDKAAKQHKVLMAGDRFDGQPYLDLSEDGMVLAADAQNVIRLDPDHGVLLTGQLSLSAMPDEVSFGGGYWRINPMVLSCLPSTTPTPVPWLQKSTPALLAGCDTFGDGLQALETAELGG